MTSLQHHERLFEFVNDSVMTRTVDGTINFWNHSAEKLYGWRKEEAIGRISHDLLQTQFPKPLEEIESELVRNRLWEGKLVHATRDGSRVAVESRWALDLTEQPGAVVEINTHSTDCEIEPEARTGKKHYIRELIFPGLATVGLLLLLAHKSEFPLSPTDTVSTTRYC
jgi:PAS domain S-box-containing protein